MAGLAAPRQPSGVRAWGVLAVALAFVALLGWVALGALARANDLEAERRSRLVSAAERPHVGLYGVVDEPAASALRAAREALRPGERFVVLVPAGTDRSTEGTIRLFANQYLFPALVTDRAEEAAVAVSVGGAGAAVRGEATTIFARGDAWVGRLR